MRETSKKLISTILCGSMIISTIMPIYAETIDNTNKYFVEKNVAESENTNEKKSQKR